MKLLLLKKKLLKLKSIDLYMCKSYILEKQNKLNFMKSGKALKINE